MLTPPLPFAGCGDILGAEPLGVLAVHARHLLLCQRLVRGISHRKCLYYLTESVLYHIVSQKVSFHKSRFPDKSFIVFFIITNMRNKLTDLCGY